MERLLLLILLVGGVALADGPAGPYLGRKVVAVIDEFRAAGEPFAYSTNIVTDELLVISEPQRGTPLAIVREILRPHGLMIQEEAGVLLVVRDSRTKRPRHLTEKTALPRRENLEMVIVAASRYEISRDISTSRFTLDQRSIQNMPDLGEDPIRVTQRLPGTAASGASAIAHFRGGEEGEIGIMLNGQWLFDPFHIRDYQSIFSTIDARAIEGVEVYTGGFPVRYGDRMSGLVLMDSLQPEQSRHNEIGISVFNTSVLSAGIEGPHGWLFSARRGNLDLVIDPEYGQPKYYDLFGEYTLDISTRARISANALFANDQVTLILETDPGEREQVVSDTRNAQFWLRLDSDWSATLSSSTVLSIVNHDNRRNGFANDPEKLIAAVSDNRAVRQLALQQDWVWSPSERHRTQWGVHIAHSEADYDYDGAAEYFGMQRIYRDRPETIARSLRVNPAGGSYALYASDRWRISDRALLEWGLRWDDQTYTDVSSDSQLSPRLSFLYRPTTNMELRIGAGRYHQSQAPHTLQVEDGVREFWPAQRADQFIIGLKYLSPRDIALRVEAFEKRIDKVRPRFENLYDPLGIMPELQADRVLVDPTSARARGIEVSADRSAGPWNWWLAYTWSRVTDQIGNRDVPRSWDQRHALQAGISRRHEAWNFSAAASVHTGWPTTDLALVPDGYDDDGEPRFVVEPGARNARRLPTFASLDMRLSRRFDVRRGTLLAFVEVSNVLNRNNVCCTDFDLTESVSGDEMLEVSLDYWLPLLPAVGILWEF